MRLYASIYVFAFILLTAVAFILPYYSEEGMTILGNSISDLGAQQTNRSWVINFSIAFMSIATLVFGSYALKRHSIQLAALYFFCVSFGMTGIFKSAGLNELIHYNYTYDALHFLFYEISGIAFAVLCISLFFKIDKKVHKFQTIVVFLVVVALSLVPFQFSEYQGIFHRLIFIVTLGWLFYAFTCYSFKVKTTHYFNRISQYQKFKKNLSKNEE
ncbi:DUF998 domain-containing protein [Ulvibacter antarcticus]|uniref:Uncharacterized protein DUF998 n=1 Tax=Ulvibacter antarcticus TaxID=442714 RepID=A0A3L9YDI2_9FLAO|nr:DUF998 domain-containing protein [Ulvibacter antarcticus]RMA58763.1 uncharacterized protein DUF998 [Ulvibacter antarcticus]